MSTKFDALARAEQAVYDAERRARDKHGVGIHAGARLSILTIFETYLQEAYELGRQTGANVGKATHVTVVTVEFDDGGDPEETVACYGSLDECERTFEKLPAIVYNGPRPPRRAYANIRALGDFPCYRKS